MLQLIISPSSIQAVTKRSVFLAGSIDNGVAEDWQSCVTAALSDLDLCILNPRRMDWDASWRQSIDDPQFRQQVEWELDALDQATWVLMHITAESKAPITLLELGLHVRSGKLLISCEPGYWRRGNIEVVAARFGIPLFNNLDAVIEALKLNINEGGELL